MGTTRRILGSVVATGVLGGLARISGSARPAAAAATGDGQTFRVSIGTDGTEAEPVKGISTRARISGDGRGFVTVYPCDASQPNSSNLNFAAGQTVPNAVITKMSAAGEVCFFASAATQLVVDVAGWLP